jgi:hypothetical protein
MVRGGASWVVLILGMGAVSGCGSGSHSSRLACSRSVEDVCSSSAIHCSLTWDEVLAGPTMCWADATFEISDCGNYHRLIYRGTDVGSSFYYDAASGQLVAIVEGSLNLSRACGAGPPDGFEEPNCGFPDGGQAPIDCGPDSVGQFAYGG